MNENYIYLKMEPYLRQWFVNSMGGVEPVRLFKGSIESKIVQQFVRSPRANDTPKLPDPGDLAVIIPHTPGVKPWIQNYFSPKATEALMDAIRARFDVDLFTTLHKCGVIGSSQKILIESFMDSRGIEDTETNFNTLVKRYRRLRIQYLNARRKRITNECKSAELSGSEKDLDGDRSK